MNTSLKTPIYILVIFCAAFLTSCYTEDPGPIQDIEKNFTVVDFDRLEMGDAFNITVEQGSLFEIEASGDRRNIDDLVVEKEGSTLVIRYDENRSRRHSTSIKITMPRLRGVNFSGGSDARIFDFDDMSSIDINLSGASVCQIDAQADNVDIVLSGASYLYMNGSGEMLNANISGASNLKAFNYPVATAEVIASGASDGKITVTNALEANASGASVIIYRGNPTVTSDVSGSSTVKQD